MSESLCSSAAAVFFLSVSVSFLFFSFFFFSFFLFLLCVCARVRACSLAFVCGPRVSFLSFFFFFFFSGGGFVVFRRSLMYEPNETATKNKKSMNWNFFSVDCVQRGGV